MDFLGLGPGELILILVIALIFLGPGKIVDFARTLGKWVHAIRRAGTDFTTVITREIEKAEHEPPSSPKTEEKPAPPQVSTGDGERHP
jgi:Sec-independent protein translocase protein TatA